MGYRFIFFFENLTRGISHLNYANGKILVFTSIEYTCISKNNIVKVPGLESFPCLHVTSVVSVILIPLENGSS